MMNPHQFQAVQEEKIPVRELDEAQYNICCIIEDSLRWDVFVSANPTNILKLGTAHKCYSVACSTLPSMTAYMMNYPPIGLGRGLFHQGYWSQRKEGDMILARVHHPIRKWMPRYYKEKGYKTVFLSGNAVPWRLDEQTKGMFTRYFDYKPMDYLEMDIATPQIIRDLDKYVEENKDHPIFAVLLLLDTHSPYHDGRGNVHLIDPSQPDINYEHQELAMKYANNVFPNFINTFSKTERPTEFIFTSDHGENFAGNGWGHSSFRKHLLWGEKLFAIPFVRGCITDWSKFKVYKTPISKCPKCGNRDFRHVDGHINCKNCGTVIQ